MTPFVQSFVWISLRLGGGGGGSLSVATYHETISIDPFRMNIYGSAPLRVQYSIQ